ncbi:hypothetical protein MATL_G00005310 [Megalops atlanticus]|uniref:Ig-like domain-containing protein n=1 Tax=Megalops atlanticus TaxID=7932 RepID=A0A9D3QG53_MEGAT|nr:hypothetical protein MATL_G00005310 [Megalops atlanticus]
MPEARQHCSVKELVLINSCILLLWVSASVSDSAPPFPPAPSLSQETQEGGTVHLLCQAPTGHTGVLFRLFRVQEPVDSVNFENEQQEARFSLGGDAVATQALYCCLYKPRDGIYSNFSPYLTVGPVVSPPPQPFLSVEPPGGRVRCGQSLSFRCSAPPSQGPTPQAFLLLRQGAETKESMVSPVLLVSRYSATPGSEVSFDVGPVRGEEGGFYTCLYQVTLPEHELLPAPTLSLGQDPKDEFRKVLECTGSPSYPGAQFSLLHVASSLPVSVRRAPPARHTVLFPLPVHQRDPDRYQCQYSVLLGDSWGESERSRPLTVLSPTEKDVVTAPPPPPPPGSIDWPLVAGSVSAVLLFLVVLAGLGIAIHRKVKAVALERQKREQAHFWTCLHSRDHILDITLNRVSIGSQEWGPSVRAPLRSSSSPTPQYPLSTFLDPPIS